MSHFDPVQPAQTSLSRFGQQYQIEQFQLACSTLIQTEPVLSLSSVDIDSNIPAKKQLHFECPTLIQSEPAKISYFQKIPETNTKSLISSSLIQFSPLLTSQNWPVSHLHQISAIRCNVIVHFSLFQFKSVLRQ